MISKINEWKCNRLFLATEDKSIVQMCKNIFGDFCVTFDREYVDYKPGQFICLTHIDRPNDYFIQGKDYLTQMVLLSTCNSFVGAQCNGTFYAVLAADKFEHIYIFNLGRYGTIGLD